jgi:hypothetical protein
MGVKEECVPSPSPTKLAHPYEVRADDDITPKIYPLLKRRTRSESRISGYDLPSIIEPSTDDDSGQEGVLAWPIAAKTAAAPLLSEGAASKGPSKTAYRRCGHLSLSVAGVARIQRNVIEEEEHPFALRLTLKAVGTPNL